MSGARMQLFLKDWWKFIQIHRYSTTVKPRPEVHMDMTLFEVFLKSVDLIPQQILQLHYL